MTTYLGLCNQVAGDSATADDTFITNVTAQTGRKAKIVRWVNQSWRSIQNAHQEWSWMQSDMLLSLAADTQFYAGTTGTDNYGTLRFGTWVCRGLGENRVRMYDSTIGLTDIRPLQFVPWDDFQTMDMYNGASSDKPARFSIHPGTNRIGVSPIPDGDDYRIIAPYRKSAQTLSANADIPEMPEDFHDLIATIAVQTLHMHDEGTGLIPLWKLRENLDFCRLEAAYLPMMMVPGPLA